MRHKWKKRLFIKPQYNDYGNRIYDTSECVKCGLRKGYSGKGPGFFPTLLYFVPEKILSVEKLPFSCNDEWIGGSLPINKNRVVFICEDEFKV